MSKNVFVVGTGTDVGKTYVTALILKTLNERGINAGYYKAAVSGNDRGNDGKLIPGDAAYVKKMSGISQHLDSMCPYIYERAVSPHLASQIEGNAVEISVVEDGFKKVCNSYDYVVMEGSGGILCPIRFDDQRIWLEDVIKHLNLSCVLIADAGLGTINQVGLSCHYMKSKGIDINGIIFNHYHPGDVMEEDNIKMCESLTGIKVIGFVKDNSDRLDVDYEDLMGIFR